MKLVRHNVFETNSSSCHSLSVNENAKIYDTILPDEDGYIYIELSGEYGWEQDTYYNTLDKVDYIGIYARDWTEDSEKYTQILIDVIKEHTGANDVLIDSKNSSWGGKEGYIDHQSVEDRDYHYLFENPELLKKFIFGEGSYFECDNDNH